MPRSLKRLSLRDSLIERTIIQTWKVRCTPRILIVTDGGLDFSTSGFGLFRFLEAITLSPAVILKPLLTLAHRDISSPGSVTVGPDTYQIAGDFKFDNANPAVTKANYDQIWLFGINPTPALPASEVAVIADFMNSGGGVFATGDHADLGFALSGGLPRIRHMREWVNVPMGDTKRIDTIVDPGAGSPAIYEFDDQSDDIPQRIYPKYTVTGYPFWTAKVHRLLMLPGAPVNRTDENGFAYDMDCLPDHPHESVCYAVTDPTILGGNYADNGLNFPEFQQLQGNPGFYPQPEIVAYGVSGGRSVAGKPPVEPQMFGIISAYNGHLAAPYAGKPTRPGRIVCDATWHHFININLDGTGAGREGLGTWSGGPGVGTFTPGPFLDKIYQYFCNMVEWLMPLDRIWCSWWWPLVYLRYHPLLIEELVDVRKIETWEDLVVLGRATAAVLSRAKGPGVAEDLIAAALRAGRGSERAELFDDPDLARTTFDRTILVHGILGGMLHKVAEMLPANDLQAAGRVLERDIEKNVAPLVSELDRLFERGVREEVGRAERTVSMIKKKRVLSNKPE